MGNLTINALANVGYTQNVKFGSVDKASNQIKIFSVKPKQNEILSDPPENYVRAANDYDKYQFHSNGNIFTHELCRPDEGKSKCVFNKSGQMITQHFYDDNDPTKLLATDLYYYDKDGSREYVVRRFYEDDGTYYDEKFEPGPLFDNLESGIPSENETLKELRKNSK